MMYQYKSIKTAISTIESTNWQQFIQQLRLSDFDGALNTCQTAMGKSGSNTCWNLGHAWTLFAKGDPKKALNLINQAAKCAPEHPMVFHSLALAHAACGNHQQAVKSVGKLYQQLPKPKALELLDEVENFCDTVKHKLRPVNFNLIMSFTDIEWMLPALRKYIGRNQINSKPPRKKNKNGIDTSLDESQNDGRTMILFDKQINSQLSKLFGQSLFGSWVDPNQLIAIKMFDSIRKARRYSMATILIITAMIALVTWIISAGLDRRTIETRSRIAEDIRSFLQDGNLSNAEQYLKQIAPVSGDSRTSDSPFADLIARTEATLYRFVDADPKRLTRIRHLLKPSNRQSSDAIIARALIAPSVELPDMIDGIRSLAGPDNRDPEVLFLLALALERSDKLPEAIHVFDRSEDLGPDHLPHLERITEFLFRRGHYEKAVRVIDRMIDINPRSPWTLVAEARNRALGTNSYKQNDTDSIKSIFSSDTDLPPVLAAEKHFILALAELKNDQTFNAREHIQTACLKIHHQPTFLLDYFTRLLDGDQPQAADLLRTSSHWPTNRPSALVATEKLKRIIANQTVKEKTY